MKRTTAQSNTDTVPAKAQDFGSLEDFRSLTAGLPAAQWQQYAEASAFGGFAAEWAHETDEKGETHSFWDEFLQIFNIRRRQFARHEARANRSDNRRGFIDLFWPGKLLIVTYLKLRLLDLEVVRATRLRTGQLVTNTDMLNNVWLTQFHGTEQF